MEVSLVLLFSQELRKNPADGGAFLLLRLIHAVGLVEELYNLRGVDLVPAEIQDDAAEGNVLCAVGIVHDVRREQHELPGLQHV